MSTHEAEPQVLRDILRKGKEKLDVAQIDLEHGYFGEASSRAYYAAFHAITAVLAAHGLSFSSHAQTIGAFNREFVKAGTFSRETTRILTRLFENRQIGDYSWNLTIDTETAECDLRDARKLWHKCLEYLEDKTGESLDPELS